MFAFFKLKFYLFLLMSVFHYFALTVLLTYTLNCVLVPKSVYATDVDKIAQTISAAKLERYIVSIQRKSLKYNGHSHLCAGTILTSQLVLTTAHCLFDASTRELKATHDLQLVTGLHRLLHRERTAQVYNISALAVHEQYNHVRGFNDIALVLASKRFESVGAQLSLPLQRAQPAEKAILLGWGTLFKRKFQNSKALSGESTVVLPDKKCLQAFGVLYANGMLCAAFQSSCAADAGSPLFALDNRLIGIVAFGISCGGEGHAGAFTDIYFYAKWIKLKQQHMQHIARTLQLSQSVEHKHTYAKHVVSIEYAEQPYMLYRHLCAGVIVSNSTILTAASCIMDSSANKLLEVANLLVIAGVANRLMVSNTMQILNVKSVTVHKNYTLGKLTNDLAVLRLRDTLLEDNMHRQRIHMPSAPVEFQANGTAVQWPKLSELGPAPGSLTYANVSIAQPKECFSDVSMAGKGLLCVQQLEQRHLRHICLKRIGSPLIINKTLYGILELDFGCSHISNASIFTDVWYYKDWITQNAVLKQRAELCLMCLAIFLCVLCSLNISALI